MKSVEKYIYSQVANNNLGKADAKQMLKEVQDADKQKYKDIAIIGIACKLPQANNVDEFWDVVTNEKDCLSHFPEKRMREWMDAALNSTLSEILSGVKLKEGLTPEEVLESSDIGGYLDDISSFDYTFFDISPKEAKYMSPEQRLVLQNVWEAVEDAGYGGDKLYGTKTNVYIGKDNTNMNLYKFLTVPDTMHITGSWSGILSSRISYLYNLKGSSLVVDTACSSGLVSLHLASRAIMNGECDMAIVGGVQMQYMCSVGNSYLKIDMVESDDNIVRTFDNDANGTVWSEGLASVIVKPLDKAIKDGDNIQAVIKASAINNDGASNGITAPNAAAQEEVILKAWEEGEIDPEKISYFEAHGTGTVLGDPIEIKGLTDAFRKYTNKKQFCAIGSTKANIGHTVAASGLVGVIKIILAMKNKMLPPCLNFAKPNQYINFLDSPVYVHDTATSWNDGDEPVMACINAFGFSGTNAHLVLQSPPKRNVEIEKQDTNIFCISAKSKISLEGLLDKYIIYLSSNNEDDIENICYTANTGRGHYNYRIAVICHDKDDLCEKLRELRSKVEDTNFYIGESVYYAYHKIVNQNTTHLEGEITESYRNNLSKQANSKLKDNQYSLDDLCNLYIKGASVQFDTLYEGKHYYRISIPTYSFEKKYCFADMKELPEDGKKIGELLDHPLFDYVVTDTYKSLVYESVFNVEKQWILSEHLLMGTSLIPGVAYIEMGREICSRFYGTNDIEFYNLTFLVPLIVNKGENIIVQTLLEKSDDHVDYYITSKDANGNWNVHAKGSARKLSENCEGKYDFDEINNRCDTLIFDRETGHYDLGAVREDDSPVAEHFTFGGRWNNTVLVKCDETKRNVLITLELDDKYKKDLNNFYIHPALIDNAANSAINMNNGVYLPFIYKKIQLYGQFTGRIYSYLRMKTEDYMKKETIQYDVTVFDEDHNIIAEISDYSIKRMNIQDQLKFKNSSKDGLVYCKKGWEKESLDGIQIASVKSDANVLMFMDDYGFADKLKEQLNNKNVSIITVRKGTHYEKVNDQEYLIGASEQDYHELIKDVSGKIISHIVHGFCLDNRTGNAAINKQLDSGVYSLFYLVKQILENKLVKDVDMSVLTYCRDMITEDEKIIVPSNEAVTSFAKVIPKEYRNFICKCIDIDDRTDAEVVINEVLAETNNSLVAYRNNERYYEQLGKYIIDDIEEKEFCKENGTYVITGGTGALGLFMADFISKTTKANFVLVNRSQFADRSQWADIISKNEDKKLIQKIEQIREIEQRGCKVEIYSADVTDMEKVKVLFDNIQVKYHNVDGIIHLAGVAGDGYIMNKDMETMQNVLQPKIQGLINLDQVTSDKKLDFFLVFSSIVTIEGSEGQSDYSAANAFMEAYTKKGVLEGKNMMSICWPAWKEIGMAYEYQIMQKDNIFRPITNKEASDVLKDVFTTGMQNMYPLEINKELYAKAKDDVVIHISKDLIDIKEATTEKKKSVSKKTLNDIFIRGKEEAYTDVEKKIALIWCEVLDINEVDIYDNFSSLGGDSILASVLCNEINEYYPNTVDITDVFTYSTISSMAEYITEKSSKGNSVGKVEHSVELDEDGIRDLLHKFQNNELTVNNILERIGDINE